MANTAVERKPNERAFARELMENWRDWVDVVGLPSFVDVFAEYQISPKRHGDMNASPGSARSYGWPRVDGVGVTDDGLVLVETKVTAEPCSVMGGVAQLLYYKTVIERAQDQKVAHLVLALPSLPPMLADMIETYRLPIRTLHVTSKQYAGYIPRHFLS